MTQLAVKAALGLQSHSQRGRARHADRGPISVVVYPILCCEWSQATMAKTVCVMLEDFTFS